MPSPIRFSSASDSPSSCAAMLTTPELEAVVVASEVEHADPGAAPSPADVGDADLRAGSRLGDVERRQLHAFQVCGHVGAGGQLRATHPRATFTPAASCAPCSPRPGQLTPAAICAPRRSPPATIDAPRELRAVYVTAREVAAHRDLRPGPWPPEALAPTDSCSPRTARRPALPERQLQPGRAALDRR